MRRSSKSVRRCVGISVVGADVNATIAGDGRQLPAAVEELGVIERRRRSMVSAMARASRTGGGMEVSG